ncbi:MAG: hypothetical protein ACLU4J_12710 [Butyricimonas paravirosa]
MKLQPAEDLALDVPDQFSNRYRETIREDEVVLTGERKLLMRDSEELSSFVVDFQTNTTKGDRCGDCLRADSEE